MEKHRHLAGAWMAYCAGGEVFAFPVETRQPAQLSR